MVLLDGRPQVRLGLELEISVDREDDAASRLRVLDDLPAAGDLLALGGELDGALPGEPARSGSYWRSSPVIPTPSTFTNPRTWGATGPAG